MALVAQSPTLCGSKPLISPKWKKLGLQAALENAIVVDHNKILTELGGAYRERNPQDAEDAFSGF